MIALVDLETVKSRLRVDGTDQDDDLQGYIYAASKSVLNYLKGNADALLDLDTAGEMPTGFEVPDDIQMATIVLIGYFLRNPDGDPDKAFEPGFLPAPVTAILYPLRDPALA